MSGFFETPETIIGTGSAPIGPAGGELSGFYPFPNVITINGAAVPDSGSVPVGNVLQISSSDTLSYAPIDLAGGSNFVSGILPISNQAAQSLLGDLSGTTTSAVVAKINGATVPSAGSLVTGNILQVTGTGSLGYSPINLAGGTNYVTGTLPAANQASQILSGDLSGTTSASTVIKINGTSVAATPSANQLLIASSSSVSSWSLLADANVSSSAAIAGTKLSYSDVSSPALGATTIQGALDAIKTVAVATAIQRLSQNITTANLQAAGAIATATFNVGAALPANARVLGAEINVTQALAGLALSVAVATVQGSGDIAGSLIATSTLLTTGLYGGTGTNQYLSRGGQQLTVTVTLTGPLFNALTGGAFTVNVFYAVIL